MSRALMGSPAAMAFEPPLDPPEFCLDDDEISAEEAATIDDWRPLWDCTPWGSVTHPDAYCINPRMSYQPLRWLVTLCVDCIPVGFTYPAVVDDFGRLVQVGDTYLPEDE